MEKTISINPDKIIKFAMGYLRVLFHPTCWGRNARTNRAWDRKLNEMLDNPTFSHHGGYIITLNGTKIWIENKYYAYGSNYSIKNNDDLPSRRTVFRLVDSINEYLYK